MSVKFKALQMMFEVQKIIPTYIYMVGIWLYIYITKTSFLMLKPFIFTPFTSIGHILLIQKPIPMIFVTLDAPRKGLQIFFNVQTLLTNVEKIIKLYLQRFFTYLWVLTILKLQHVLI
jgi:hypothetical protein